MEIIVTPKTVIVLDCKEENGNILIQIEGGAELLYAGEADFHEVHAKTLNRRITLGIDPSNSYCVFLEDIWKQQLR